MQRLEDSDRGTLFSYYIPWTGDRVINCQHVWKDSSPSASCILDTDCRKSGTKRKCAACHIVAHQGCCGFLSKRCKPSFSESYGPTHPPLPKHHWVTRKNLTGKCRGCQKGFRSGLVFQNQKDSVGVICSWCKYKYHAKDCFCREVEDSPCTLGEFGMFIVPPSWIVRLPSRQLSDGRDFGSCMMSKRRSFKEKRAFLIKPTEGVPTVKPLIVFVNPKSGGNRGFNLMMKFLWYLNPRQVFDLNYGGPRLGLELYRKVDNLQVLVCGGDGTVNWVLAEIDKLKISPHPAVAVLPLGTGNDLSRFLLWGGGYTDEPLSSVLSSIDCGEPLLVDRWNLEVRSMNDNTAEQKEISSLGPLNAMINYFSIGADAEIALQFHENREANPERFNNRLRNMMFYGKAGSRAVIRGQAKDLYKSISQFICDGVSLMDKLNEVKPQSLLFLNISKYSAGTNPWGHPTHEEFLPQSCNDGYIEVIGFTSTSMVVTQVGGHGVRLFQCQQAMLTLQKPVVAQVDGEPSRLFPCKVSLSLRNKANMLCKVKKYVPRYHCPDTEDTNCRTDSLKVNVMRILIGQYEKLTCHDLQDVLPCGSPLTTLHLNPTTDLVHVREVLARQSCNETEESERLSENWCFIDAGYTKRLYRIDLAQEDSFHVNDVIADGVLFVVDYNSRSKEEDNSHRLNQSTAVSSTTASTVPSTSGGTSHPLQLRYRPFSMPAMSMVQLESSPEQGGQLQTSASNLDRAWSQLSVDSPLYSVNEVFLSDYDDRGTLV